MAQIRGRCRRPSVGVLAGLAALALVAGAAGCGGDDGAPEAAGGPERPLVVVTTSILGDVVHQVAGEHLEVQVLMGAGVDPHEYQASARDAERIRRADLVVVNGGHLEGSLLDAVDAAQQEGVEVFTALDHADPRSLEGDDGHDDDGHDHGDLDPHFWQDPRRMALVVDALGPVLAGLAPSGDAVVDGAEAYAAELRALDADDERRLDALPPEHRKLVTDHDAFGYFADRYAFTIVGVIIPGGGTAGQASARDLADLADAVTRADVPAIFSENTLSARTADALAREAGHQVAVVQLFSDALGRASSGATTYADLVRTNTDRILDALG